MLTFVIGEQNDKMDVIMQGRDNGAKYSVEFHHSREWRMFRYRNPLIFYGLERLGKHAEVARQASASPASWLGRQHEN